MSKCPRVVAALLAVLLLVAGCGGAEKKPQSVSLPGISGPVYLGELMPDVSLGTDDGQVYKLSELLAEKKLVVLNFWYADCYWCVQEFPVMEVAYQRFRQDVEILAMNPYDSPEDVAAFQKEHSLSMPMGFCSREPVLALGVNSYPTSVFVDREGRICLIHSGAITDVAVFNQLFETFTAEDYTSRVYNSINELLA